MALERHWAVQEVDNADLRGMQSRRPQIRSEALAEAVSRGAFRLEVTSV